MQLSHRSTIALPAGMQRYGKDSPPELLLIICTDAKLDSLLLPRFCRAPLLVWRSTGPVVPPYGPDQQEVEKAIDHALSELGVKEIAICGHLPNEPLQTLISDEETIGPSLRNDFLYYVQSMRLVVQEKYGQLQGDELVQAIVEENVLMQMANLRTYPAVLAGMANGKLRLHRWLYDADEDELYSYGPAQSLFLNRFEEFAQSEHGSLPYLDPCDIYLA